MLPSIDHPGVPAYVDWFELESGAGFALVQELAPGASLEAHVREQGALDEAAWTQLAERVLDVLVYLQEREPPIVHRDIKPSNVLLAEGGRAMLVDFGAVKHTYETQVTGGSTVVGTFGYMAPEQLRGRASRATDVFGLAATLLFAATGADPSSLPERNMRPVLDELGLSPRQRAWLDRAMEPDDAKRYATAREAREALRGQGPAAAIALPEPPETLRVTRVDREGVVGLEIRRGFLSAGTLAKGMGFGLLLVVAATLTVALQLSDGLAALLLPLIVLGLMGYGAATVAHLATLRVTLELTDDAWRAASKSVLRTRLFGGPIDRVREARALSGVGLGQLEELTAQLGVRSDGATEAHIPIGDALHDAEWVARWFRAHAEARGMAAGQPIAPLEATQGFKAERARTPSAGPPPGQPPAQPAPVAEAAVAEEAHAAEIRR